MKPLVSVVIPNYNCAQYLDKCLDSISSQTYQNFECLVCDDGSTDDSIAIIKRHIEKDSRIKLLVNTKNIGHLATYNKLFFASEGEYIMIQDADDWSEPTRIEKQLALFSKYDIGLCVTNCTFYSAFAAPAPEPLVGSGIITPSSSEEWAPATIMFKATTLATTGGFNPYFERLMSFDRYMIMDILADYGGYYLDEHLYNVWARPNSDHRTIDLTEPNALRKIISYDVYKQLHEQRIATGTDWLKDNKLEELKDYEQTLLNNNEYMAKHYRRFACIQIDNGLYSNAWTLLKQALKSDPLLIENYKTLRYLWTAKLFGRKAKTDTI